MANTKKLIQAAAGAAGGAGLNVEDVFSNLLYVGDATTTRNIVNGIDYANEGGFIMTRDRAASNTFLWDTERGVQKHVMTSVTSSEQTNTSTVKAFNDDGYTIGNYSVINGNNKSVVSWGWRKAPKFVDIITYTGNGTSGRTISHNLDCEVGCIWIKSLSSNIDWVVYHRGAGKSKYGTLNSNTGFATNSSYWNNTAPTTTEFTLGDATKVNGSGVNYVAYVFAHNNGDGEFGPTADQDIIKCGSYVATGSQNTQTINLGFEPQFLWIKKRDYTSDWYLVDNMRGCINDSLGAVSSAFDGLEVVRLHATDAEESGVSSLGGNHITFGPTSFSVTGFVNSGNNESWIYLAVRRGPMGEPEDVNDVFEIDTATDLRNYTTTNFPVDLVIQKDRQQANQWNVQDRLRGGMRSWDTNSTAAENSTTSSSFWSYFDYSDAVELNFFSSSSSNNIIYSFKRAPSFFDAVCYTGTGSTQNISHNLGVEPEMMWVKRLDTVGDPTVYHKNIDVAGDGNPAQGALGLSGTTPASDQTAYWNDTKPTSSVFTVGTKDVTNGSGSKFIAYLFASLDGVSKFGGYTGNGTSQTINVGFQPRFVCFRKWGGTAGGAGFVVYDTVRGINAGNEPYLQFSNNTAEVSTVDWIDLETNGFSVSGTSGWNNVSGGEYLYWAIA